MISAAKLYDPIRCKQVNPSPEERVRQALLRQMLEILAFPKGLIAVEKKVAGSLRRADIVVYRKAKEALIPLLLVECKASCADEATAFRQATGYLTSLAGDGSLPFWCLAHASGIRTFWQEGASLHSVPFLPPYPQLVKNCS